MKITKIRVDLGMTIPLGAYELIRPGVSLEAEVSIDADRELQIAHSVLYKKAKVLLYREARDMGDDYRMIREGLDDFLDHFFSLVSSEEESE